MRNFLFIFFILIILAAIGGIFWLWQGKEVLVKKDVASPTLAPQRTQNQGSFPSNGTKTPAPSYQKPAEDAVIKFPIFNYHHIRPMPSVASSTVSERAFTVSPEGLEMHLKYFRDNGYQVVSLYDLLDYFDTGRPLSTKAVAITFDDGYYGHYKWAYPLLKKYGMSATFFIVVNYIGKQDILTWPQIKEMSDGGMIIGSHALNHPHMSALDDEQLRQELVDSKRILEEKIGRRVDLFAYPGGDYDARVIQFVKDAGYQAALGVYKIIEQGPKFRYTIRRFHADDAPESITEKLVGY